MLRIGIDTGGTFTDFVVIDQDQTAVFKLPSTPSEPQKAILEGLSRIAGGRDGFLVQLGSTVATNALLERRGAKTLLVTNQGFEDLIEIGRQNRPDLYKLTNTRKDPLVPSALRIGVRERTLWDGTVALPLEAKSLDWLVKKVQQSRPESIAVALLYSYLNPTGEEAIAGALEGSGIPVSLSHQVLPEFREFERTSATVINAYVMPLVSEYLSALSSDPILQKGRLSVMQSNGGSVGAELARKEPVRTLLSGPAGGVVGAFQAARQAGYEKVITLDMGGTSTDVCLCDGGIQTTNETNIDQLPVPIQMISIHTIGAGGGSIAWVDSGGLLRVGPQSAGADPGPICYGTGSEVTVTDANVFLGRMEPDYFLGGEIKLLPERIRPALEDLGKSLSGEAEGKWNAPEVAEGIIQIVNTQMERALRVISLQRGFDTRDFTLVSFGGAAGLHACELARALLIPRVLIPSNPGVLSAAGILRADVVRDASLTVMRSSRDEELVAQLKESFAPLEERLCEELRQEGFSEDAITIEKSLDLRYAGQSYELNVVATDDFAEQFHRLHEQFYGYCNPGLELEVVNIRVRGTGRHPLVEMPRLELQGPEPSIESIMQERRVFLEGTEQPARFYLRERLKPGNRISGPAIILEYSATTLIPSGFEAAVDEWLNLVVTHHEGSDR